MSNTLTDTDKFKLVFEESKLNQTQFASKISITPGSLSGILSGRTKPTMALFRSISQAFPTINPMWLFADDPNMHIGDYAQSSSTTSTSGSQSNNLFGQNDLDETMFAFGDLGKSAIENMSSNQQQKAIGTSVPNANNSTVNHSSVSGNQSASVVSESGSRQTAKIPAVDPEVLASKVAMKLQKPPRQITEIRIFFDDGTYETFGPHV